MTDKTNEYVEKIITCIDDEYEFSREHIETQVEQYIEYDVGFKSLKGNLLREIAGKNDVSVNALQGNADSTGSAGLVDVNEIEEPNNFVSVEVQMVEEWDSDVDSIAQTGLVGDDTGKVKFTSWAKSESPLLVEGESYKLENVATDEYNGWVNIQLNSATEVTMLDEDVTVSESKSETESFSGIVVDVKDDCGLIERCSVEGCSHILEGGECPEHGDVDGEFDLRIKAVVDDGNTVRTVLINRELAEKLTGTTLSEAQEMAQAELDRTVVREEFKSDIMLKYIDVDYYEYKGSTIAEEVQFSNQGE